MSNPLLIVNKCLTTFFDFLHIAGDLDEHNESALETVCVINQIALFVFSSMEITLLMINPSNNPSLAALKTAELTTRCINLVIQVFKGPRHLENETKFRFLGRAVFFPIVGMSIAIAEYTLYTTRHLLNLFPAGSPLIIEHTKELKKLSDIIISSLGLKALWELRFIESHSQAR